MTRLVWGLPGDHIFETGVDRGVFYPQFGPGVPWNGLISVKESSSGSESTVMYVDGQRLQKHYMRDDFLAVIEAFTYPEEFLPYDGIDAGKGQQRRSSFGLSYRTFIGNDTESLDYAYRLHIVYNALTSPTNIDNHSQEENIDLINFQWNISTTPSPVANGLYTAHYVIDSREVNAETLILLEEKLYGGNTSDSYLPTAKEVFDLFEATALFKIIDHGDGTFTATGPDEAVHMLDATTFELSWPSVFLISEDTYRASSF